MQFINKCKTNLLPLVDSSKSSWCISWSDQKCSSIISSISLLIIISMLLLFECITPFSLITFKGKVNFHHQMNFSYTKFSEIMYDIFRLWSNFCKVLLKRSCFTFINFNFIFYITVVKTTTNPNWFVIFFNYIVNWFFLFLKDSWFFL